MNLIYFHLIRVFISLSVVIFPAEFFHISCFMYSSISFDTFETVCIFKYHSQQYSFLFVGCIPWSYSPQWRKKINRNKTPRATRSAPCLTTTLGWPLIRVFIISCIPLLLQHSSHFIILTVQLSVFSILISDGNPQRKVCYLPACWYLLSAQSTHIFVKWMHAYAFKGQWTDHYDYSWKFTLGSVEGTPD